MDILTVILILIFLVGIIIAYVFGQKIGSFRKQKEWEACLPGYRREAVMQSRAILGGQFSEQLAPFLPDFEYSPTECKFLGKPIDLIVFKGMDNRDINEVVFVEVKSGNARLTPSERRLRDAIRNKRVSWKEYRIPKDLTRRDPKHDSF